MKDNIGFGCRDRSRASVSRDLLSGILFWGFGFKVLKVLRI